MKTLKSLAFFTVILVVGNGQNEETHPCVRECDGIPMLCQYHYKVETYYSLDAMACYDCPNTPEDCYRPDCITAGGINRTIVTANRQLPGPTIEVCENDTIEVLVQNNQLSDEPTSIHWHGQYVKDMPYMDGVPWVTQCPILSNNNFTYRLLANIPGTHFWHSHEKTQRGDGMYGMLVVHVQKSQDPHGHLYDEDLTAHQVSIIDWNREAIIDSFGQFWHGGHIPKPDGILINGLGYMDLHNIDLRLPIAEFIVQKGKRYRFRFVNAEFFDCPFSISIDNHKFTVISTDGHDVEPQVVNQFIMFTGERYDVILDANQDADAYWFRVKGLEKCVDDKLFQVAILRYQNSLHARPRTEFPTYETAAPSRGLLLNPLFGNESDIIPIDKLKALTPYKDNIGTDDVHRRYIKLSLNPVENPIAYRYPHYGFKNVSKKLQIFTPSMNDISFDEPGLPLLPNRYKFKSGDFCNNRTVYKRANCIKEYCHCTHIEELPLNRVVELIIFDTAVRAAHHPLHLHGHSFRVVAWKRLGKTTSRAEIEDLDRRGLIKRNFNNPPRKDTIHVPPGGYVILRFLADNPGFWLFHCHVDTHSEDGMRMVFKVGKNRDMYSTPRGFPTCRSFKNA